MLLIDSGNSSIKCRWLQSGTTQDVRFNQFQENSWSDFRSYLSTLPELDIFLASVAPVEVQQRIRQVLQQVTSGRLHLLETLDQLGKIQNGYRHKQQLGVDRWLALLGASSVTMNDAMIVDAGSAITIDLLTTGGDHLGGAILPGFEGSEEQFQGLFPHIDISSLAKSDDSPPGRSTQECLRPDAFPASAEVIRQLLHQWRPLLKNPPDILLTGQDAEQVASAIDTPYQIVPDLIFKGMLKQIEALR